ncbi:hypothetical protein Bmyc01_62150 [Bacillus mycoides]|nr:hypothetical protein Bmyc01_62150 [Bacillus mycoides]
MKFTLKYAENSFEYVSKLISKLKSQRIELTSNHREYTRKN